MAIQNKIITVKSAHRVQFFVLNSDGLHEAKDAQEALEISDPKSIMEIWEVEN